MFIFARNYVTRDTSKYISVPANVLILVVAIRSYEQSCITVLGFLSGGKAG